MSTSEGKVRTLVVLSGGLDSAVALYASELAPGSLALAVNYGQNNGCELQCAAALAKRKNIPLKVVTMSGFGHILAETHYAGMTAPGVQVTSDPRGSMPPSAYVPARNLIFLSIAASIAEATGCQKIVVGFIHGQWTGDAQQSFVNAMNETIRQATECEQPIWIHAPLIHLSKQTVVRLGMALEVPFAETWSCQNNNKRPACGICGACIQRWNAFRMCGSEDPIGAYEYTPKVILP